MNAGGGNVRYFEENKRGRREEKNRGAPGGTETKELPSGSSKGKNQISEETERLREPESHFSIIQNPIRQ